MSQRPAFPGGPIWKPPGDLFGIIILGALAVLLIVVVHALAPVHR